MVVVAVGTVPDETVRNVEGKIVGNAVGVLVGDSTVIFGGR